VLGLFSIVAIVIGTMIGSGIFINPPKVAQDVKTPELIMAVWLIGGILSFFGALSLAELPLSLTGIYLSSRSRHPDRFPSAGPVPVVERGPGHPGGQVLHQVSPYFVKLSDSGVVAAC
jgi:hypothetical protein